MFTGLVETTGRLSSRSRRGPGFRVRVATGLAPLELGESVSVSGACLTVAELASDGFEADMSVETHDRTILGAVPIGGLVNLERSLRLGDRLGGHLVSGHVDGIAEVTKVTPAGEALRVAIRPPKELSAFIAPKGSVTLDGVSLTVNAVDNGVFEIMLIPHTLAVTTLDGISVGRRLNVEVDLLARYVVHYLTSTGTAEERDAVTRALERAGFV